MFNQYYEDELNFLREMGREFAEKHPSVAHLLAGRGSDPDVERLLEGVAFLSGRVRQKLDDDFPELTHTMMNLLYPHFLRPLPAMTLVQFDPVIETLRTRVVIPRGTTVESVPVEGTPCRFRTCGDVALYPLRLTHAQLEASSRTASNLVLRFEIPRGLKMRQIGLDDLCLHFAGEAGVDYDLYLWLCHYVKRWTIRSGGEDSTGPAMDLPLTGIQPAGFSEGASLLPYPPHVFQGYRLLQEYFSLPEKFLMVNLMGLDRAGDLDMAGGFEMIFEFSRPPAIQQKITVDNFKLYCSAVVNLFSHEADPIRVDQERFEYNIRPAGGNPKHYEVYSIDKVTGFVPGTAEQMEYRPFFSFKHAMSAEARQRIYYHHRIRRSVVDEQTTMDLSFININQEGVVPPTEIVSMDLTCSNGRLPEKLRIGDIKRPTSNSPEFARFSNIGRIARSIPPPLGRDIYWILMSHWSLNYTTLCSLESLRNLLTLYNFQGFYDRRAAKENDLRMSGIRTVRAHPEERFLAGVPIRGTAVTLEMEESHFVSEGDLYLFSSVLNEFMALYTTLNSFVRLTVKGSEHQEVYHWQAKSGEQILI